MPDCRSNTGTIVPACSSLSTSAESKSGISPGSVRCVTNNQRASYQLIS